VGPDIDFGDIRRATIPGLRVPLCVGVLRQVDGLTYSQVACLRAKADVARIDVIDCEVFVHDFRGGDDLSRCEGRTVPRARSLRAEVLSISAQGLRE
jgi:hypothetical protein